MASRVLAGLGFTTAIFLNADLRAQSARTSERALLAQRERVAQATVMVPAKSCAGVVAGDRSHVLTAAHCVPFATDRLSVRLRDRTTIEGEVEFLDRDADLAIIGLDQPSNVEPLEVSDRLSVAGDRVLFVGRTDRRSRAQVARVERTGRCPSLPGVEGALSTSVQAKPGDFGRPAGGRGAPGGGIDSRRSELPHRGPHAADQEPARSARGPRPGSGLERDR